MSSDLKSITKVVYLKFNDNTFSASQYISIPFGVKEIICRQVFYQDDQNIFTALTSGCLVNSDLVENQTLSIVGLATYSTTSHFPSVADSIRFVYKNFKKVEGTFNFQLRTLNNGVIPTSNFTGGGNYVLGLLIEFVNEKE